jgi:hypothetical protein
MRKRKIKRIIGTILIFVFIFLIIKGIQYLACNPNLSINIDPCTFLGACAILSIPLGILIVVSGIIILFMWLFGN